MAFPVHASEEDCDGCETTIVDPEPNWETAAYTCPSSIKTEKGEHISFGYSIYDSINGGWSLLKPEPRKYLSYRFLRDHFNVYLVCGYKGIETEFIIHAKDATACGDSGYSDKPPRIACWTTDPYAR